MCMCVCVGRGGGGQARAHNFSHFTQLLIKRCGRSTDMRSAALAGVDSGKVRCSLERNGIKSLLLKQNAQETSSFGLMCT